MKRIVPVILFFMMVYPLFSQTVLSVGATENQPPYTFRDGSGIAADIITELNKIQNEIEFRIQYMPSERTKRRLNNGTLQMLVMVNINWGYDKTLCNSSLNIILVEDKFFTLKSNSTQESYFDQVGLIPTVVVNQFSYRFLNFQTDFTRLPKHFNVRGVLNEPSVIQSILSGRAKIGVSSSTTLAYFGITNPEEHSRLFISSGNDSSYSRHIVLHKEAPVTIEQLNEWLQELSDTGIMSEILSKYGL